MAKQTFTTGQVLTAAQMTSLQATALGGGAASTKTASYVLVAADAGTTVAMNAAGATTITVNTGLFAAGDTVFIQNIGAGVCTITAGTATVNTAGALALPQYDAGILYFTSASAAIFYDYIQVGAASPLTTKGDLYTFSTSDTRLGVGANNTVLTADSAEATGLKWAAASGGGLTLINSGGTTLSGASTSVSSIPATYKNLHIYIEDYYPAGAGANAAVRFNNYVSDYSGGRIKQEGSGGSATPTLGGNNAADRIYVVESMAAADNNNFSWFIVPNYASTVVRKVLGGNSCYNDGTYTWNVSNFGIWYGTAAAIDSVQIMTSSTWSGGKVYVYGEN